MTYDGRKRYGIGVGGNSVGTEGLDMVMVIPGNWKGHIALALGR